MKIPLVFNEKVLAGLSWQIRRVLGDREMDPTERNDILGNLCMTPWEVAEVFEVPYPEVGALMDRYRLHAIFRSWDHVQIHGEPNIADWGKGFDFETVVPLYSPEDIYKSWQRHQNGDPGENPPPLSCDVDHVLRGIWRGWSDTESHLDYLVVSAHDTDVLIAALTSDAHDPRCRYINDMLENKRIWASAESLKERASRYWKAYGSTALGRLRQAYDLAVDRSVGRCRWVSPTIIQWIESASDLQEARGRTKWLLYKAETITKGQLAEEEHNRMLAEALVGDKYSKVYVENLRTAAAPGSTTPPSAT